jgi:hypothetical protein
VIPTIRCEDGAIVCTCGGTMSLERYISFPNRRRHIYYRCDLDRDHVTASLPLQKRRIR